MNPLSGSRPPYGCECTREACSCKPCHRSSLSAESPIAVKPRTAWRAGSRCRQCGCERSNGKASLRLGGGWPLGGGSFPGRAGGLRRLRGLLTECELDELGPAGREAHRVLGSLQHRPLGVLNQDEELRHLLRALGEVLPSVGDVEVPELVCRTGRCDLELAVGIGDADTHVPGRRTI